MGDDKHIYFMFDSYWLDMDPYDFIYDVSGDGSVCALSIVENPDDFILFGISFLRGFYTVHEMSEGLMAFAPHAKSNKRAPFEGTIPEDELEEVTVQSLLTWVIFGGVTFAWTTFAVSYLDGFIQEYMSVSS